MDVPESECANMVLVGYNVSERLARLVDDRKGDTWKECASRRSGTRASGSPAS